MPNHSRKLVVPNGNTRASQAPPLSCILKSMVSGIKQSLKSKGVRLTRQRQILLDLIDQSGKHLDAESLYHLAKEKDPKLNRVTVYRTLKMLKAGGLVDELDLMHFNGEQHYYETRSKQEHAHVVCLRCGVVEEFFGEPLQRMRRQVESNFGFQVLVARTEIGGYCPACQAIRAQEMKISEPKRTVRHRPSPPTAKATWIAPREDEPQVERL
jgi:Fur family transcriptional regulator, ferric uptake regulator